MKIVIVGHGFVGKAVDYAFHHVEKRIVDPKCGTKIRDHGIRNFNPDFVFVCVPTPMGDDGSVDDSIVRSVLDEIKLYWQKAVVIIKSTIIPDNISTLIYDYSNIVYNPEFLTERSANSDFVNAKFHILGSNSSSDSEKVKALYERYSLCNKADWFFMKPEEAAYVKYGINTFLALKVIFFNQLYENIVSDGLNPMKIINAISYDERIGSSHTKVPGYDGKLGYGGACFPKDVSALINSGNYPLLEKVHEINNEYRANYELDEREIEQKVKFK